MSQSFRSFDRRNFLKAAGLGGALAAAGCATTPEPAKKIGRVIVIGAGYGGATAAKYLRMWGEGAIEVFVIDSNPAFVSCPLSNLVLGGSRKIEDLTVGYTGLRERGIQVINDTVTAINVDKKTISLNKIQDLAWDRLIVSPGIEFMFDQVGSLKDTAVQQRVLHAWRAGPQTVALRKQLEDMRDGGVYVLSIPLAPYRCPPGPYERACQVAHYFKTSKPKSKVIILDANPDLVSKPALFRAQFNGQYKGIIEYRNNSEVKDVNVATMSAIMDVGGDVRADVLNVVPPQRAANIAQQAGLITANNRWCGVNWLTMESTARPGIHVLGDATLSAPAMPKSGHMANQHAKVAAAAIIELMNGRTPSATPMMANTCYSFVDDKNVVHVASVHAYDPADRTMKAVPGSGGLSSAANELEGAYANAWARNIWNDMLG
ncbi:MAG: FAD-dependent oxidoreductase [Burkholderiales bacterium]|nr:FAD-dependent oxidoreductase [Burkholderiales bacterium]